MMMMMKGLQQLEQKVLALLVLVLVLLSAWVLLSVSYVLCGVVFGFSKNNQPQPSQALFFGDRTDVFEKKNIMCVTYLT